MKLLLNDIMHDKTLKAGKKYLLYAIVLRSLFVYLHQN